MNKIYKLLATMALLVAPAFAQSFVSGQAFGVNPVNVTPVLLSYAQVRVCRAADVGQIGTPCADLESITDIHGQPLSVMGGGFGQLTTSVVGQFSFGCVSGDNLWIQVAATGSNTPQVNYATTCGGGSGSGGIVTPLALSINNSPFGSQTALNFVNSNTVTFSNLFGGVLSATVGGDVRVNSIATVQMLDSGTVANTYKGCAVSTITIASGLIIPFIPAHSNTGASTFSLCGATGLSITKLNGLPLIANDLLATGQYFLAPLPGLTGWSVINPSTFSGVTFKVNGNLNDSQTGFDLEDSNSLTCNNLATDVVLCEVFGNLNVSSVNATLPGDNIGVANQYGGCPGAIIPAALTAGLQMQFTAMVGNTGASTFSYCSDPVEPIVVNGSAPLTSGMIAASQLVVLEFGSDTKWHLINPVAIPGSGSLNGQQQGQPAIGLSATTVTTKNATFEAQAFTGGADTCAKIKLALQQCPTGSTQSCEITVAPSNPGSVDICSATTSNFWQGVNTQVIVDMKLNTILQLKQPLIWPTAAHIVHGIGSNQNFRGAGFKMDSTFTDPGGTPCSSFAGAGEGPFPAGTYNCLIIDGGTNGTANAFGGLWDHILIDCNFHRNCIGYYTLNMQEGSGLEWVRCWGTGANTGSGSVSACGFWDHFAASGTNSGPSHFRILHSFIDPWANTTGSNANGISYGWVVEDQGSGGNILISGGTIRGANSTDCNDPVPTNPCLMEDAIWIDSGTGANVEDIHCEWMNTDCVAFHNSANAKASNISDVNHAANGVHFYSGSAGGTAFNISSQGAEVQDDVNGCTTTGSSLEFYTQDSKGQGWWNASFHSCGTANNDNIGALAFAGTTTQTFNFLSTYTQSPQCTVTPNGNATAWATTTSGVLTIHTAAAFTGSIVYQCVPRGN